MARLVTDFYKGETEYSDGDIESELYDIVSRNDDYDGVLKKDKRWPIVYHLSHLRHNILNWYPFKKGADILEVGAGCGAITGLLCEKASHVTAVELTKRRAGINYERNKNCPNLDIYVGDIFKVGFEQKFDYVTVIGVLEYAAFMSHAKDPYSNFLGRLKSFLKPGGHILIAIENRFGLKYFAGAREDHTARFFDGVNGYENVDNIRTFTKNELTLLLDKNALGAHRFYYPLPDYKFPSCIYTDDSVKKFDRWMNLGTLDNQRYELFDEIKVMRDFASEGVLDRFANSFFVDAAADGTVIDSSVVSAKLSAARNPEYRIATIIKKDNGNKTVLKAPLSKKCRAHLDRMADNFTRFGSLHGIPLVPCHIDESGNAVFDFAKGEKFSNIVLRAYRENGPAALWPLLDKYREKIFSGAKKRADYCSEKFTGFFGGESCGEQACVNPANIDLTFDNLIVDKDSSMTAVDYEWIMEFDVPAEYIFWRSIFFSDIFVTHDMIKDEIFEHYKITKSMRSTFLLWETAFSNNKIGSISLEGKSNNKLDINELNPEAQLGEIMTGVAFDTGNGYDMEHAVHRSVCKLDHQCTMRVPVQKDVKSVRFDPVEGFACSCQVVLAKCGNAECAVTPVNSAASFDGADYFLTLDPVYSITGNFKKGGILEIKFVAKKLDPSLADMAVARRRSELEAKIAELESQSNKLRHKYDSIINSRAWKVASTLRNCKRTITGGK